MAQLNLQPKSAKLRLDICALILLASAALICLAPEIANASVETSLNNIQMKLTRVILPCLTVCGIVWAAISLLSGNERAKSHVFYAILASVFGFGAQAIVDFIRTSVN